MKINCTGDERFTLLLEDQLRGTPGGVYGDISILRLNLAPVSEVPEPATAALLLSGAVPLLRRRARRQPCRHEKA